MGLQDSLSDIYEYAFPVFRTGLGLMLLLAGLHALFVNPGLWQSYVAPWFLSIWPFNLDLFMTLNAVVEVVLGVSLIFGFYTTFAAFASSLVLAGITINVATAGIPADIVIRDIGLVFLAVGVTLTSAGRDGW